MLPFKSYQETKNWVLPFNIDFMEDQYNMADGGGERGLMEISMVCNNCKTGNETYLPVQFLLSWW